ncbi:MAG: monovalent cation/H(+) antiporter subunit G [Dehalococcoidales bacterium]|jgi:multicomponent Na+:H+ antiporter subunit G|nr:cation:proton antiporter [Dehalococcoidales bacterium]MDP6576823.1 monovalent cation/H(+) antiporter subunit G [Dehalococcoidales bacterium]MDP6825479.1 monovalent cation/H(+) antiporter subunit G [Dehalococcoidales bacterium]MDP7286207.1 monovalent cation/H(+) antiporter subunit G [Dehalococcoidales bacterium]MDP7416337.1 monovalent cation/H(+) antiporter subunit G [Dehalococcoidales bacterium]|tara:strand:+ start:106 stop:441 length:336 start_codon:yes stop_codon:yes gene_type:complete
MVVLAIVLVVGGAFFLTVSAIGLLRLPDFYARVHAVGKSETLGTILVLSGLAVYNGWELSTVKVLFIMIFVLIANPTATHAISRAALRSGLAPWTRKKRPENKDRKGTEAE